VTQVFSVQVCSVQVLSVQARACDQARLVALGSLN
jgi:hypothetical protein